MDPDRNPLSSHITKPLCHAGICNAPKGWGPHWVYKGRFLNEDQKRSLGLAPQETERDELNRLFAAHQIREQRAGRRIPMTGRLAQLAKQFGVAATRTEPIYETQPENIELQGPQTAYERFRAGERGDRIAGPQTIQVPKEIKVGEQEVEDIPAGGGRRTFGEMYPTTRGTPLENQALPMTKDGDPDYAAIEKAIEYYDRVLVNGHLVSRAVAAQIAENDLRYDREHRFSVLVGKDPKSGKPVYLDGLTANEWVAISKYLSGEGGSRLSAGQRADILEKAYKDAYEREMGKGAWGETSPLDPNKPEDAARIDRINQLTLEFFAQRVAAAEGQAGPAGEPAPGTPGTDKPGTAKPGAGRTITPQQLSDIAIQEGVSYEEAENNAKEQGYTIAEQPAFIQRQKLAIQGTRHVVDRLPQLRKEGRTWAQARTILVNELVKQGIPLQEATRLVDSVRQRLGY